MTWVLAVCGLRHADRERGSLADPSFPAAVIRGAIPRIQEARPIVWMHGTHALLEQQALPRVPREWMRRGLVDPLAVRTCAMWQCACRLFSSVLPSAAAPCGWLHWLCVLLASASSCEIGLACDCASVSLSLFFVLLPHAWCVSMLTAWSVWSGGPRTVLTD